MGALFDPRAEHYDRSTFHHDLARDAVELVQPPPGDVLDVGTGTGLALRAIARLRPTSLTGVDVSAAMLEVARREVPDCRFVLAAAEDTPFGPASFDTILCVAVLPYLDAAAAAGEWRRVLRSTGQVVVTAHEADGVKSARLIRDAGRRLGFKLRDPNSATGSPDRLRALAEISGLRLEQIERRVYTRPAQYGPETFDLHLEYFPPDDRLTKAQRDEWREAFVELAADEDGEEHRVLLARMVGVALE